MSSIGPSVFLPTTFAGNAAANAAQQKEHQQVRDGIVAKNFERDLKQKTEKINNDVSDLDLSEDRDADGRLTGGSEEGETRQEPQHEEQGTTGLVSGKSRDPDEEIGMKLDLEA